MNATAFLETIAKSNALRLELHVQKSRLPYTATLTAITGDRPVQHDFEAESFDSLLKSVRSFINRSLKALI